MDCGPRPGRRAAVQLRVRPCPAIRIFLQTLLQYSDQADVWLVNARFGVLDTAGTGLYVVYNETQESHGLASLTGPMTRSFIVKYSRRLRVL